MALKSMTLLNGICLEKKVVEKKDEGIHLCVDFKEPN